LVQQTVQSLNQLLRLKTEWKVRNEEGLDILIAILDGVLYCVKGIKKILGGIDKLDNNKSGKSVSP
jgi:hypothetical protein